MSVEEARKILGRWPSRKVREAARVLDEALERLREERDAWKQRHIDSERDWRKEWLAREAAEAEVQRYREGLRFIAARRIALETFGLGNVADVADRALLADRPDGDCEHEWVSARNEAVLSGLICVKCHALAAEPDGAKPEGGEA